MYVDNKQFHLYCTKQSKEYCVRRSRRGVWRQKTERLGYRLSKPRKTMKCSSGQLPVQVTAGVHFSGAVFFSITSGRWNARSAKAMYRKLNKFMEKKGVPKYVCEDNDPAGYSSKLAIRTKQELNMTVLKLPKRSPELQPLDYSVWAHVEKVMAKNNENLLKRGVWKESRDEYLGRLRKAFLRLPKRYLENTIDDVKCRVSLMQRLRGDIFRD